MERINDHILRCFITAILISLGQIIGKKCNKLKTENWKYNHTTLGTRNFYNTGTGKCYTNMSTNMHFLCSLSFSFQFFISSLQAKIFKMLSLFFPPYSFGIQYYQREKEERFQSSGR